jgi:hypothetical protein
MSETPALTRPERIGGGFQAIPCLDLNNSQKTVPLRGDIDFPGGRAQAAATDGPAAGGEKLGNTPLPIDATALRAAPAGGLACTAWALNLGEFNHWSPPMQPRVAY